jgi:hypothetical protein
LAVPTDVTTTSFDLRRMNAEAIAAGFNPLTVLRNGGAAGFATSTTRYEQVPGGSFTQKPPEPSRPDPLPRPPQPSRPAPVVMGEPAPGRALPVAARPGGRGTGGDFYESFRPWFNQLKAEGFGGDWNAFVRGHIVPEFGSSEASPGEWERASEQAIAASQLRMRNRGTGNVVTDDGVVIRTRPGRAGPSAGGMLNPIAVTGSTVVRPGRAAIPGTPNVPASFIERPGFQPHQVYQTDKLPNVIEGSTFHPLAWGLTWEETGGNSRGETWETVYGDDNMFGWALQAPKFIQDVGTNFNRLDRWAARNVQPGGSWSSTPGGNTPPLRIVVDGANPIR